MSNVGNTRLTLGQLLASQIFVCALGRGGKTARKRQRKVLYTELLKSWSTPC